MILSKILLESKEESIINQLNNFYKTVDYGTVIDGKTYIDDKITWQVIDKAHLLSAKEIEKYKVGTCYDTAGYSFRKLASNSIQFKCYLSSTRKYYNAKRGIWDDPVHTFIICKDSNDNWRWIEGSWYTYMNNKYIVKDDRELVSIIHHHINKENGKSYLRQVTSYPTPGCSYHEFYKLLMTHYLPMKD